MSARASRRSGERTLCAERLDALETRVAVEHRGLQKLQLLKAGLMEDLLTGRVRVTKLMENAAE
jgi:type I restriction enzyme S subunit